MRRVIFILFYFLRTSSVGGGLPDFLLFIFFPVQQTTSGIGHREKSFIRVGNQNAESEKQQQQYGTWYHKLDARGAKPALHAISMLMLEV